VSHLIAVVMAAIADSTAELAVAVIEVTTVEVVTTVELVTTFLQ